MKLLFISLSICASLLQTWYLIRFLWVKKSKPWKKNWPGSSEKLCKRVVQALACCLAMSVVFWLVGCLCKQSESKQSKGSVVWPHTWCERRRRIYWHQPKTHCGKGKHSWMPMQSTLPQYWSYYEISWELSHENFCI